MSKNIEIWNQVKATDPRYTKQFQRGGGFSGTAINAVYLIQKATELWGPMGGKWGIRIVKEEILQGAPLMANEQVIGHELVHKINAEVFHPDGFVPSIGLTTFVGKNRFGVFTDEEAPKKSLTDALTKGLSWLGFAADVHLGLYDDNKYVSDLKQAIQKQEREARTAESGKAADAGFDEARWLDEFDRYTDIKGLREAVGKCKQSARDSGAKEAYGRLQIYAAFIADILKCANADELDIVVDRLRGSGMSESHINRLVAVAARRFNKENT